jgi:16S rRNA G966 N2-methylase RsmD
MQADMTETQKRLVTALVVAPAVLAAYLVIVIQPVAALALLPSTGGNPILWHASQALFQALLLAGYLTAGFIVGDPRPWKLKAYAGLALLGAMAVLLASSDLGVYRGAETLGVLDAIRVLFTRLAVPVVVLATASLTAQFLYVRLWGGPPPFWIYAMSNTGSLAAAFTYPILIEPTTDVSQQLAAWKWVAACVVAALAVTAVLVARIRQHPLPPVGVTGRPGAGKSASWFVGGFVPVGLNLSCITYLATDLGSHPIVWLGPFAAYLLTLILAFTNRGRRLLRPISALAPGAAIVLGIALFKPLPNNVPTHVAHLICVTVLLARWHQWLSDRRPTEDRLSQFYSLSLAGGACASALLGFFGPVVFDTGQVSRWLPRLSETVFGRSAPEYGVFLGATLVLLAREVRRDVRRDAGRVIRASRALAEGVALGLIAVATTGAFLSEWSRSEPSAVAVAAGAVGIAVMVALLRDHLQLFACVGTIALEAAVTASGGASVVEQRRTAFGTIRVLDSPASRTLMHGTTLHGDQAMACVRDANDPACDRPSTYYTGVSPIGQTVERLTKEFGALRIGVVGLGAGTAASYCRGQSTITFFEIDPSVTDIANTRFRYLETARRRCAAVRVVPGDARLSLRVVDAGAFDLVIADAFSSDAVPAHLLTVEATRDMVRTLSPRGVIAYHTSSRYLDVEPIVLAGARAAGLVGFAAHDQAKVQLVTTRRASSRWVIASKDRSTNILLRGMLSTHPEGLVEQFVEVRRAWTDQRHSLVGLLFARGPR